MLKTGLCLCLVFAFTAASPWERIRQTRNDAPVVIDIPADLAASPSEDVIRTNPSSDEVEQVPTVFEPEKKPEFEAKKPESSDSVEDVNGERPSIFGIRLPTIMIYRRPLFQNPFFSLRNPQPEVESTGTETQTGLGHQETLFDHMDTMMKRMQDQMSSFWGSLLSPSFQRPFRPLNIRPTFTVGDSDEDSGEKDILDIDRLPANYTNSTSETKMVDGQMVTVNKTVHKVSSNNSNGFFHFSVVKIHSNRDQSKEGKIPSSTGVPELANEDKSSTTVKADPKFNEIDGAEEPLINNEKEKKKYEYEIPAETQSSPNKPFNGEIDDLNSQVEFVPLSLEQEKPEKEIKERNLRSDIRVNKLLEKRNLKSGGLSMVFNPDAELI